MSNDNVIISCGRNPSRATYHTGICHVVRQIDTKQYVPESTAIERGHEQCDYCSGDFPPDDRAPDSSLSSQLFHADPEEVSADD